MEHRFVAVYPWGSTYISRLIRVLDIVGVGFCDDPRQQGSDCWGLLVGGTSEARAALVALIESTLETADEDDEDWDASLDEAIRAQGVARLLTDWKHLEVDDHAAELAIVGLSLERLEDAAFPTFVLKGPAPTFCFEAQTPEDIAPELFSMMGVRVDRHQALDVFDRSPDRADIARAMLRGCTWEGTLTGVDTIKERWYVGGATPPVLLQVVLHALGALPADEVRTLTHLDVSALEEVPEAVGRFPGLAVLQATGAGGFLHLPTVWTHPPRRLQVHNRKLGRLSAALFDNDRPTALEALDLLGSQVWLPDNIWHSQHLRRLHIELSLLPREDLTGFESRWGFRPTGLQALEWLELWGSFDVLPAWIGSLPSLRRLTLCGSQLRALPDEIGQLPCLEVLDIGACVHLSTVPDRLVDCTSLRMVRLVGSVVEDAFLDEDFESLQWRALPAGIRDHPTLELLLIDTRLAGRMRADLNHLKERGVEVVVFSTPHASLERLHRECLKDDIVADLDPRLSRQMVRQVFVASMTDTCFEDL